MIALDNQTESPINLELLEMISEQFTQKEIELIIIDSHTMQDINLEHRGKNKPTDVLSFPLEDIPHFPLGSILINSTLAKEKADELHHKIEEEITLLYIHGLLHLLGFDHEVDDGEMRDKEEEIIKHYNLSSSLIVRTGE
jgi:probable rRNA maturation factor